MSTVENTHHKINFKIEIADKYCNYVKCVAHSFQADVPSTSRAFNPVKSKKTSNANYMARLLAVPDDYDSDLDAIRVRIADVQSVYNAETSSILAEYFSYGPGTSGQAPPEKRKSMYVRYQGAVHTNSIISQLDRCVEDANRLAESLRKKPKFTKYSTTQGLKIGYIAVKNRSYPDMFDINSLPKEDMEQKQEEQQQEEQNDLLSLNRKLLEMASGDHSDSCEPGNKKESQEEGMFPYKKFYKLGFVECVKKFNEVYYDVHVKLHMEKREIDECDDCGSKMSIISANSELRCNECSKIVTLYGTVFEDTQFYNQQGQCSKSRDYDPNRHCDKWLKQIQAKQNKAVNPDHIDMLNRRAQEHFTRRGKLRSMRSMSCKMVRGWLKELRLAEHNDHAALIRKIVTGLNGKAVIPPQLTYEEEQEILVDFSRTMAEYTRIKDDTTRNSAIRRQRRNKPYYPYGLFKILCSKYKRALKGKKYPTARKYLGLMECIHLQSDNTLVSNDQIWEEICEGLPDYVYEPTDRNLIENCL